MKPKAAKKKLSRAASGLSKVFSHHKTHQEQFCTLMNSRPDHSLLVINGIPIELETNEASEEIILQTFFHIFRAPGRTGERQKNLLFEEEKESCLHQKEALTQKKNPSNFSIPEAT